ncbi:GNAT family N-acetyltransferase [Salinisphaera hydrothermalis]|uniref:N-acetyltransferase GCN5 n=1 Tax=Salinisphaera hydrothermalis (strain C41B8) TaxID=1304275 RepID=A0A084IQF7_SALHC|nr:GNAT family N-acetyltransferase [Salinisphaera hydrothermalis]KEZ78941.1 N-acetyltransferase GCN5 [Salinisphaera hydrothermalis C41B8]
MSERVIREAGRADLPDVLELYAQPSMDDEIVLPLAEAELVFERMQRYPDYRLYVAEHDGTIVGTYALLVMDNLGHRGTPSAVVEDVAVAPACQGHGVGRALMAHAVDTARSKGCYKLVLSSNLKRDAAHAFYESLGFEKHGYSYRIRLAHDPKHNQ